MTRAFILSVAKKGHVTQCLAVADLLGLDVEEVIQHRGTNKAQPHLRREAAKLGWAFAALRTAWRFRKGRYVILSSGRSVLAACWLLKLLRGNDVFILHIGSPKKWKRHCVDAMLRAQHEREPGRDESRRYPWNPKQIWIDAPICQSLPCANSAGTGVTVLLGGLNITYRDDVAAHEDFLTRVETLARSLPVVNIVFSRRTKPTVKEAVRQRFAGTGARVIEADDRDGFVSACEGAGAFVVTPDSITMIAEACATGKPVYIGHLPLKRSDTRNYRFVGNALANGLARPFEGKVDFDRQLVDLSYIERARQEMLGHLRAWQDAAPESRALYSDRPKLH
ncbi:MAG: ELM1/GtrOC1 family putative glycosyltransferase [Paracoccus sp. (in: a-proteobacteria)]